MLSGPTLPVPPTKTRSFVVIVQTFVEVQAFDVYI